MQYECKKCSIFFKDKAQLANHLSKFCVDSVYADPKRLRAQLNVDEDGGTKERLHTKNGEHTSRMLTFGEVREYLKHEGPIGKQTEKGALGSYSLAELRRTFQSNEKEMERIKGEVLSTLKKERMSELADYKKEQKRVSERRREEQRQLKEKIRELEKRKKLDLMTRIEKQKVKLLLQQLDEDDLLLVEKEKKREIDMLLKEKKLIEQKEQALLQEVEELEGKIMERNTRCVGQAKSGVRGCCEEVRGKEGRQKIE